MLLYFVKTSYLSMYYPTTNTLVQLMDHPNTIEILCLISNKTFQQNYRSTSPLSSKIELNKKSKHDLAPQDCEANTFQIKVEPLIGVLSLGIKDNFD